MSHADAVTAIRHSVAVTCLDEVAIVRLSGTGVYDALDRIVPADLYLRDGQVIQSVLLDEEGRVFADVYLASDDEDFLLLAEGPAPADLLSYLERHVEGKGITLENQSESHQLIALDGPYAWELLAMVAGSDVVGLPYLTHFHLDPWIVYRAGKTGEYGYGLIVPAGDGGELHARLLELGRGLDAVAGNLHALDQCALENWYFNVRREGKEGLTPIELQLQWRVSYGKAYVGSEALARHRRDGVGERLTCLVADSAVEIGARVSLDGAAVGRVVNAGFSEARGDWAALALMEIGCAHPGISGFRVTTGVESVEARSETPPLLNNRSLHVSPQLHSYATRHEFTFPPLRRR